MDARSLYNPFEKRQPEHRDFQYLGLQRALGRAPQPRYYAQFGLKLGAIELLVCPGKTGPFMQVGALIAGDWCTVELAERMLTGSSPCGGRGRERPVLLGGPRSWWASWCSLGSSPIRCSQTLPARQLILRPRTRKQRRIRLSVLVAARTASQVGCGKAHP